MYLDMSYMKKSGTTEDRPVSTEENPIRDGRQWFDTDLQKPIFWDAENEQWKDAVSNPV